MRRVGSATKTASGEWFAGTGGPPRAAAAYRAGSAAPTLQMKIGTGGWVRPYSAKSSAPVEGDAASTLDRAVLVRGVSPDFSFQRFKLTQPGVTENAANNDRETKLLSLTLRAARTSVATAGASNSAVSARYMLRNKRVAH